jgi:hypothetical protein
MDEYPAEALRIPMNHARSDNPVYVNQARHDRIGLTLTPINKRAVTVHVEEAGQRPSEARADAGRRRLHTVVRPTSPGQQGASWMRHAGHLDDVGRLRPLP